METIGNRIKYLRRINFETQQVLADAIGASYHMISFWENGRHKVPSWAVCAICHRYKVSADWLLGIGEANER